MRTQNRSAHLSTSPLCHCRRIQCSPCSSSIVAVAHQSAAAVPPNHRQPWSCNCLGAASIRVRGPTGPSDRSHIRFGDEPVAAAVAARVAGLVGCEYMVGCRTSCLLLTQLRHLHNLAVVPTPLCSSVTWGCTLEGSAQQGSTDRPVGKHTPSIFGPVPRQYSCSSLRLRLRHPPLVTTKTGWACVAAEAASVGCVLAPQTIVDHVSVACQDHCYTQEGNSTAVPEVQMAEVSSPVPHSIGSAKAAIGDQNYAARVMELVAPCSLVVRETGCLQRTAGPSAQVWMDPYATSSCLP